MSAPVTAAIDVEAERKLFDAWFDAGQHNGECFDAWLAAKRAALAQPAPCVICGSDEPRTGTCGSGDPRALCNQVKPTPAAPQPDWRDLYEKTLAELLLYSTGQKTCGAPTAGSDDAQYRAMFGAPSESIDTPEFWNAVANAACCRDNGPWRAELIAHINAWHARQIATATLPEAPPVPRQNGESA